MVEKYFRDRKIRKIIREITSLIKKETARNIKRGLVEHAMGFILVEGIVKLDLSARQIELLKENESLFIKAFEKKRKDTEIELRYEENLLYVEYVVCIDTLK